MHTVGTRRPWSHQHFSILGANCRIIKIAARKIQILQHTVPVNFFTPLRHCSLTIRITRLLPNPNACINKVSKKYFQPSVVAYRFVGLPWSLRSTSRNRICLLHISLRPIKMFTTAAKTKLKRLSTIISWIAMEFDLLIVTPQGGLLLPVLFVQRERCWAWGKKCTNKTNTSKARWSR